MHLAHCQCCCWPWRAAQKCEHPCCSTLSKVALPSLHACMQCDSFTPPHSLPGLAVAFGGGGGAAPPLAAADRSELPAREVGCVAFSFFRFEALLVALLALYALLSTYQRITQSSYNHAAFICECPCCSTLICCAAFLSCFRKL